MELRAASPSAARRPCWRQPRRPGVNNHAGARVARTGSKYPGFLDRRPRVRGNSSIPVDELATGCPAPFLGAAPLCDACRHLATFRAATKAWRAWSLRSAWYSHRHCPAGVAVQRTRTSPGDRSVPTRGVAVSARADIRSRSCSGRAASRYSAMPPRPCRPPSARRRRPPGRSGRSTRWSQSARPTAEAHSPLTRQVLAHRLGGGRSGTLASACVWAAARAASRRAGPAHACSRHRMQFCASMTACSRSLSSGTP
ncbi:hypothetical protein SUDANB180_07377 [Streptomyces sp. enrichment culture]